MYYRLWQLPHTGGVGCQANGHAMCHIVLATCQQLALGQFASVTHCVMTELLSGLSTLTRLQTTVLLPEVYVVEATIGWVLLIASLSVMAGCTDAMLKPGLTLFSAASGVSVSSLRSGPGALTTGDPCSSSHINGPC